MAFYCRKLKPAGLINGAYTLNGTVHILRIVGERSTKVFHMSKLFEMYSNLEFYNNDGDVSVDALGNAPVQSSY